MYSSVSGNAAFKSYVDDLLAATPDYAGLSADEKAQMKTSIAQQVADEYAAGGEQIYMLVTGQLVQIMPEDVKSLDDYLAYWLQRNNKLLMAKERAAHEEVLKADHFTDLTLLPLYNANNDYKKEVLARSVAVVFALGGEYEKSISPLLIMPNATRKLPPGVTTASQFVTYLVQRALLPGYTQALTEISQHPDQLAAVCARLKQEADAKAAEEKAEQAKATEAKAAEGKAAEEKK